LYCTIKVIKYQYLFKKFLQNWQKNFKIRANCPKKLIKFNMQKRIWENYAKFYFIGIGGVSMSGLAKFILGKGKTVAGSDVSRSVYTHELEELGVKISAASAGESVSGFDVIVYTDAIKDVDIQLTEARKLNKVILSRGQLLTEVSRDFKRVIAVSGCHGKTTVTAMLAHIFDAADLGFGVHIGGRDKVYSNSYYCGNSYFITEACEYKKNFLLLKPDVAVVLNSDADHLECYGSAENLRRAYRGFAKSAESAITLYGDLEVYGVTFGYDNGADYSAKNIKGTKGTYSFSAYESESLLGEVKLSVYGKHNVLNALAAIAVSRAEGISFDKISQGLESFCGVERRFEKLGKINGAEVIADYAHHPNEIRATLRAAKKITSGRLIVIFQPHTYSRTKNLFNDFVRVLSHLKDLLIYRTFAAREYFDDAGSALTLSQHIKKARYGDDIKDICDFLRKAEEGDVILFLGAGDIYDVAKKIVDGKA